MIKITIYEDTLEEALDRALAGTSLRGKDRDFEVARVMTSLVNRALLALPTDELNQSVMVGLEPAPTTLDADRNPFGEEFS